MGLLSRDPADPRRYNHYAKLADDGTVAAIVEVVEGAPAPTDGIYVQVDGSYPYDFLGVAIPAEVASVKGARNATERKAAMTSAQSALVTRNTAPKPDRG